MYSFRHHEIFFAIDYQKLIPAITYFKNTIPLLFKFSPVTTYTSPNF